MQLQIFDVIGSSFIARNKCDLAFVDPISLPLCSLCGEFLYPWFSPRKRKRNGLRFIRSIKSGIQIVDFSAFDFFQSFLKLRWNFRVSL